MQITLMRFVTLRVDVHKNVAFSDDEVLTFCCENHELKTILVACDKWNLAFVLLIIEFMKLVWRIR